MVGRSSGCRSQAECLGTATITAEQPDVGDVLDALERTTQRYRVIATLANIAAWIAAARTPGHCGLSASTCHETW